MHELGKAHDVAEGRAQIVRQRIGKRFQLLVPAREFLSEAGQILGSAQHDAENRVAQLVRRFDSCFRARGDGALAHRLLSCLKGYSRIQAQAACLRLSWLLRVATLPHGLHHFGEEPQDITDMKLGERKPPRAR